MDISFALLSGGNSTRFKSDKTKALLYGKPMYEYGINTGLSVSSDVMHISRDINKYKPFIKGVKYLADDLENMCPMAGLIKAAECSKYDKIFILSADMPLFNKDIIIYFYERFSNYDVILAEINCKYFPLAALYKRDVLQSFIEDYQKGYYKIIKALDRFNINVISENELTSAGFNILSFSNVNYQSDLDQIKKMGVFHG